MDSRTYEACKNKGDSSWNELAQRLGYASGGDALRSLYKRERNRRKGKIEQPSKASGDLSDSQGDLGDYKGVYQILEDGSQVSDRLIEITEEDLKSPERMLEAHGFDVNLWDVVSVRSNLWHSQRQGGTRLLLYQSRLTVKPKVAKELSLSDIDKFFENFTWEQIVPVKKPKQYSRNGKILEIDLADLHVGNVGLDSLMSVEAKFIYVIEDIVDRIGENKFERIVLVNLGDLLHYDTYNQTTTSGTQMTTNLDFYTMFDRGAKMLIMAIDRLAEFAPVEVISIYGNHDRVSGYSLMKAIEFYYRDNPHVTVDTGHLARKYRQFGNCLIFWAHGDMKKEGVSTIIQREARKEYGETKYAEVHLGHYHSQTTTEKDGVVVRYLPSITGTDAWSYNSGYTGAVRSTVSFVWDYELGLQEIWYTNL